MNYDDQTVSPGPDAPASPSLPVFSLVCLAITVGFVLGMVVTHLVTPPCTFIPRNSAPLTMDAKRDVYLDEDHAVRVSVRDGSRSYGRAFIGVGQDGFPFVVHIDRLEYHR